MNLEAFVLLLAHFWVTFGSILGIWGYLLKLSLHRAPQKSVPPELVTILQAKIEHFGLPAGTNKCVFSRISNDFGAYVPRSVFDIIFC